MPAGKKAKAHGKPGQKRTKKSTSKESDTAYISRNNAVKKLQVSLGQFRKLCILKGVFPREVPGKLRQKKRIYYLRKDIVYISHDPLLKTFRELHVYKRKAKRLEARKETAALDTLRVTKPKYRIAHVVKERFPTFADALRELDEALCMVFLFANHRMSAFVRAKRIAECCRISKEWEAYVVATHTLKKAFLSVKGIYYQVEICGQRITWLSPYPFRTRAAYRDVDYNVMVSFLDFYQTALGFVLFKLYKELGVSYPPMVSTDRVDRGEELSAILVAIKSKLAEKAAESATHTLAPASLLPPTASDEAEEQKKKKQTETQKKSEERLATLGECIAKIDSAAKETATDADGDAIVSDAPANSHEGAGEKLLFAGLRFWLSREVPHRALEFVIRAMGGSVSWEGEHTPYKESARDITHAIIDRDTLQKRIFGREYVQPQWVFDCVNEGVLLPVDKYGPACELPPHLSPFVNDAKRGYIPERRKELNELKAHLTGAELPVADAATAQAATGAMPADDDAEAADSDDQSESESEEEEIDEEFLDEKEREDRHQAEIEAELQGKTFTEGSAQASKEARQRAQARAAKAEEERRRDEKFDKLRAFSTMSFNKRRQYRQLSKRADVKAKIMRKLVTRRDEIEARKAGKEAPAKKQKVN
eukprot:m51a1_g8228 putative pescadillo homolog (651) ;mRNA; r:24152-26650